MELMGGPGHGVDLDLFLVLAELCGLGHLVQFDYFLPFKIGLSYVSLQNFCGG